MKDLDLYRKMYLIYRAEQKIIDHYLEDEMKTPMHMSRGGEHIAVGVVEGLEEQDIVCGTYRTHALYLAKDGDLKKFFAEMLGRQGGTANGKAGSMHLLSPEKGLLCTTAIVATNIPVAVGAAFAAKQQGRDQVVAVFFGDGAVDEGAFWESLNFACLKKLPIIFVYEDNDLAVHTRSQDRHGYQSLTDIVEHFDCKILSTGLYVSTIQHYACPHDVTWIYDQAMKARRLCADGPVWMRFPYYRYLEHVGVFEDFNSGYRSKTEYEEEWKYKDAISVHRDKAIEADGHRCVNNLEEELNAQVDEAFEHASSLPFPDDSELYKDVFYENA